MRTLETQIYNASQIQAARAIARAMPMEQSRDADAPFLPAVNTWTRPLGLLRSTSAATVSQLEPPSQLEPAHSFPLSPLGPPLREPSPSSHRPRVCPRRPHAPSSPVAAQRQEPRQQCHVASIRFFSQRGVDPLPRGAVGVPPSPCDLASWRTYGSWRRGWGPYQSYRTRGAALWTSCPRPRSPDAWLPN